MKPLLYFILALFFISCHAVRLPGTCKTNASEFIFEKSQFQQCHASTLIELKDSSLLAAWFGGSYEGSTDVVIYASIKKGDAWSTPKQIAFGMTRDSLRVPCWNPVLFRTNNSVISLYYKAGPNPREWWGMVIRSNDEGKNWSEPEKLPTGILGPIKNKPIILPSGVILSPSSVETSKTWQAFIERSEDNGKTWAKIPVDTANKAKVIQPTLLIYPYNRIQALFRSNQNYIMESWSQDEGKTWSRMKKTRVLNPNSGIDAVTLSSGMQVLVYNPMQSGKDWVNGRNRLAIAVSSNGKQWVTQLELENQPTGEFSYPAVIQTRDKKVHIVYTYNRKYIKHVVLTF